MFSGYCDLVTVSATMWETIFRDLTLPKAAPATESGCYRILKDSDLVAITTKVAKAAMGSTGIGAFASAIVVIATSVTTELGKNTERSGKTTCWNHLSGSAVARFDTVSPQDHAGSFVSSCDSNASICGVGL